MRLRYLTPVLVGVIALVALACNGGGGSFSFACDSPARATSVDSDAFPVEITDSVGNSVTLEEPPRRIASLSAGHTEILYAIGAANQVTAVDNTSDCPREADGLPKVDAFSPSVEAIADMDPDLVVIFFDPGDLQSSLQGLDIPVLNLASPDSVEGVYEQAELLGEATGHADGAAELIEEMRTEVEEIQSRIGDPADPPTVFHEIDNLYFTAGPGSFIHDLYVILGAENIAEATGEAFPQMSAEAIIEADPEVIILADESAGESPDTVKGRPGWGGVSAVQNDRVHLIDPDIVSRPGPRLVEALRTLAELLYPEAYP